MVLLLSDKVYFIVKTLTGFMDNHFIMSNQFTNKIYQLQIAMYVITSSKTCRGKIERKEE